MKQSFQSTRVCHQSVYFRRLFRYGSSILGLLLFVWGCTLFSGRPIQEMSDTQVAIRAAKEVQAAVLAPELYRQATELFFRAKHEYKFKNFKLAKDYADQSRYFAEQAEFESLRNGGSRGDREIPEDRNPASSSKSGAYPYPIPQGTPADMYEQRKAEEKSALSVEKPVVPSPSVEIR